jgi:hypothetical protein
MTTMTYSLRSQKREVSPPPLDSTKQNRLSIRLRILGKVPYGKLRTDHINSVKVELTHRNVQFEPGLGIRALTNLLKENEGGDDDKNFTPQSNCLGQNFNLVSTNKSVMMRGEAALHSRLDWR